MKIQKAERKAVKLKLALTGPSGAGKTMGSILLAKGLADDGKILVIDSEDGKSNLYADHALTEGIDFDVLELDAPYTVEKYVKAIEIGESHGYAVIIVDSITQEWDGQGGLLDKKAVIDARGGNSYTNFKTVTKEHESFKAKLVHCNTHLIATMRSKQDYIIEQNDKGRSAPKKVGLKPIQRDGIEYEFDIVFDATADHHVSISKDRTGLFDGYLEKITPKTGEMLREWLTSGKPAFNAGDFLVELMAQKENNDLLVAKEMLDNLTDREKNAIKRVMNPEQVEFVKYLYKGPQKEEGN